MFKFLKKFFEKLKKVLIKNKQQVFYICSGGETLPDKLSPEEELELAKKLYSGDKSAREELISRNLRLVVYTAQKFENGVLSVG